MTANDYLKQLVDYKQAAEHARQMASYYREKSTRNNTKLKKMYEDRAAKEEQKAEAAEEQAERIVAQIEAVTDPIERSLLTLRFVDHLAWPEVAVRLGLSPSAFCIGVKKALEHFEEQYLQEDRDEGKG